MKKQVCLLILFMLLAACQNKGAINDSEAQSAENSGDLAGTAPSAQASDSENQVTLQFAVGDFALYDYNALIAAFTQEHPTIHIEINSIPNMTAGLAMHEAGIRIAQSADVFDGRSLFGSNWQQLMLDLTPLIEATPTFNRDDFPANLLFEPDGTIRVLPVALNPTLLAYNKALFANAGLDEPQPDWSWDEFRTVANALTVQNGGETSQWGLVHAFPGSLAFYVSQSDGWLIDWSANPPRPRFVDPDVITAVSQHTELYLLDGVGPDGSTVTAYNEAEALINAGQAAMWPIFFADFAQYTKTQDIGIIPFPTGKREDTTMVHVDGFSISATTAHPQEAWAWLNFLSQQIPTGAKRIPARLSAQEASQYWQGIPPHIRTMVDYGLMHSFKYYFHPANRTFVDAVTKILTNNQLVEDTLTEANNIAIQALNTGDESLTLTTPAVDEDDSLANEVTTITFLPLPGYSLEPYRLAAQQFEREHPEIQVEIGRPGIDAINVSLDDGRTGDCFQWRSDLPYDQENRDTILSLDAFVQTEASFDLDAFYAPLVDTYFFQGELWGLPADFTPVIIEYNKDLFDADSMAYPQPNWTMNDFWQTAVALTHGEETNKQYGFLPDVSESLTIDAMLEGYGATLINTSTDPATFTFTDPVTIEAVRWYTDLSQMDGIKPVFLIDIIAAFQPDAPPFSFPTDRASLIQKELAAMWTRSSNNNFGFELVGTEELANLGAVPLPQNPAGQISLSFQSGYFIAAETQHRQACWQWITFLTTVDASSNVPARRSLAESGAYRQRVGNEIASAQIAAIGRASSSSVSFQWMRPGSQWLYRAIAQIIEEDVPVETALADAQALFDAYRNCVIDKQALDDQQLQNSCVQEVDPTIPNGFFIGN